MRMYDHKNWPQRAVIVYTILLVHIIWQCCTCSSAMKTSFIIFTERQMAASDIGILPDHCIVLSLYIWRHPGYLGVASGPSRSTSYHRTVYNPTSRHSENIHSDPLYRKSFWSPHREASGMGLAPSRSGCRFHTTHYVIVNEHEAHKKLLRPSARMPRRYCADELADFLELCPRNVRRFPAHPPHQCYQPHFNEEEEEDTTSERRGSFDPSNRPRSLSDLHQPGRPNRADCGLPINRGPARGPRGVWDGREGNRDDVPSRYCSQANTETVELPVRYTEPQVKPKTRHKAAPSMTETDSDSMASSSDQQNSSIDQYIQVIHYKEKYPKSRSKPSKQEPKPRAQLNVSRPGELFCSNVWRETVCCIICYLLLTVHSWKYSDPFTRTPEVLCGDRRNFQKDNHHCNTPPIRALRQSGQAEASPQWKTHKSPLGVCKKAPKRHRLWETRFSGLMKQRPMN